MVSYCEGLQILAAKMFHVEHNDIGVGKMDRKQEIMGELIKRENAILDYLSAIDNDLVDKRWLAIGKTDLQTAFMAVKRSLFEGKRVGD